jgi:tRNA threonylcarbamoyladenosine biosynthesis protein TsaB
MMVVGVETATGHLGLALWRDGRILGEIELDLGRKHCERILVAFDGLLADLGLEVGQVGGVAVSQGPGSFTGLRIGIAFAEGLALATGTRVAGVPTLDVLAHGAPLWEGPEVACLDARRGEVYFGAYRRGPGGVVRRWGESRVGPVEQAAELATSLGQRVLVIGDAAERIREAQGSGVVAAPPEQSLPRAAVVAALGAARLARGGDEDHEHVEAIYLRRSDAEIRRDTMAGRP